MKKFFAIILALIMVFVMTACGETVKVEKDNYAVIDNPRISCDAIEDIEEATGVYLQKPNASKTVSMGYIEDDDANIAEIIFKMDEKEYALRGKKTDLKTIIDSKISDPDATNEEIKEAVERGVEACNDLAGMYYIWKSSATLDLENGDEAIVAFNEGKEGFIAWLDKDNGYLYSISMEKGANQNRLEKMQALCSEK